MLTVLSWLWNQPGGRTAYTAGHVAVWASMVRRHLSMPHRLACVTREPISVPGVEIIAPPGDFEEVTLPSWGGGLPQCLRRITLFRPDAAAIFGERFVSMDVDCVIADRLDPLFDRTEDFVMYRGTNAARPYNGSMLMMTAGARPQVYTRFSPESAVAAGWRFIGSDQAWISEVLGWGEATWGPEHGVAWWGSQSNREARLMFFPGQPKPWGLLGQSAWVSDHYRGTGGGRCLILGYGPRVWKDATAALGPFQGIIASPEAAEHVKADFVVDSDRDALILARALGFDEIVHCGRSDE